ncbi:hypothetical protein H0H93_016121 [Arthromyces matolae]|nr:hypothetical protein H0H93_016121 [Arthromyces matolae]
MAETEMATDSAPPWYQNRVVYVQAQDSVRAPCRIYAELLVKHSEFFCGMFDLIIPTDESWPGVSADNPLPVPISEAELQDVRDWFYREWDEVFLNKPSNWGLKEQKLVNLLAVSRLWEMKLVASYAVKEFDRIVLSYPRRLELAQRFSIVAWADLAIRSLLDDSLKTIAQDSQAQGQIGFVLYSIIARARESLHSLRIATAFSPPELNFPDDDQWQQCFKHEVCKVAWEGFWWKHFARAFLHPDTPMPFEEVKGWIEQQNVPGLANECKSAVLRKMEFSAYYGIINKAVSLAKEHISL